MGHPGSLNKAMYRFFVPSSSYHQDTILLKQLDGHKLQKGHLKNDPDTLVYAIREAHLPNTVQVGAQYDLSNCILHLVIPSILTEYHVLRYIKIQIIMMNGEKHTKYDVNLEKGTTEWVGEKMANELISIDKRKKNNCHYVFVIQSIRP